jgi:quercetin dioxygenase-like cupin family protein
MVTVLFHAGQASATDASGFTGVPVAKAVGFPAFDVSNKVVLPPVTGDDDPAVWLSKQKTKGLSDLYVVNNTWAVGGTTGWHTHPGHSLIIVTAGTITDYESDDPTCTGKVYTAGMSFVDEGGTGHAHVIRNEGTVPAQNTVVQLVPTGANRRINVLTVPANCPITIQ